MSGLNACARCGRVFDSRSKPVWAFTTDGRPAGRIHASCRSRSWLTYTAETQEVAHFLTWVRRFRPGELTTAEWDVLGWLIGESVGEIDERLLAQLAASKNERTPEQIADVRVAYHRMIQEFNDWRRATSTEAPDAATD
jgi:hypothetical protein